MRYQIYSKGTNKIVFQSDSKEAMENKWRQMSREFRSKHRGDGQMLYDHYSWRAIKEDDLKEEQKEVRGLDENKVIDRLQQLRKDWYSRWGNKNGAAEMCANDILDFIWEIKTGKCDIW